MDDATRDPWLLIPAEDYESHMAMVGQSELLRVLFSDLYAQRKPRRLAVLGCTTGGDLELVDPDVTELVVGLDLNPAYLEIARRRLKGFGSRLHLIQGNALDAELAPVAFDLVHAALLLEYVDPVALFWRIHRWLSADGVCSVITQEPTPDIPDVTATRFDSLQLLRGRMSLRTAAEVEILADQAGLRLVRRRPVDLASGKRLVHSIFRVG
jgi:SAM-dependent methyltransferase